MATKKKAKAKKKAGTKKAGSRAKAVSKRPSVEQQLQEVRNAVEDLGHEFQLFRDGLMRSSRALLQGVIGFREALTSLNPLTPGSIREAGRRLGEGVQRFVRALQGN